RQRHPKLEQEVRPLRAFRIILEAVGESRGGIIVILANVEGLAEPILRSRRQRVLGMLLDEAAERLLGILVPCLPQQAEGGVVLILRIGRAARKRRYRGLSRACSHDRVRGRGAGEFLSLWHADQAERTRPLAELLWIAAAAGGRRRSQLQGRIEPALLTWWWRDGRRRELRRAHGLLRARLARDIAAALQLAEAKLDVALQLLQVLPKLLNLVGGFLDLSRHRAHLVFNSTDAHLEVDRRVGIARRRRRNRRIPSAAAVDLSLQKIDVALEAVQAIEQRANILLLGARERRRRQHQQYQTRARCKPPHHGP